ncbi:Glycosyltransferase involved in cell wall bisynthesis [Janthinobacterium psychrotolerans]|uniref:Glycosyltransferase involved in cell wall bisynthesis n=2 Tax=Janthinobacterium psychrotolerans TaxID=1747903 RepID=A0A1A7C3Y6_9BURK|nr:Glycosyltransferase involved in cell wall bisynthesis [Janthinobacterium psychrotolerans]
MLLGPALDAVSGVTTHLNQLFHCSLARDFHLVHFQVGSEGRRESRARKLLRLAWSPFQFLQALRRQRPQIVHINTSMEQKSYWRDLAYLLVAKAMGKRVLYQVHGGALPQVFFGGKPLLTGLLRRVLRLPDAVVLLAQCELRGYRSFDPGLPVEVIPNAIDAGCDAGDKPDSPHAPLSLVYVGRLAESKGLFELVEALHLARAAGSTATLALAGSGPAEAALRARVGALGLQEQVRFLGPVFGAAKHALWRGADVFGFPTHHEGLPYALLESMAARTPMLICPVGAIPDVVQDGVHGLFVPPRDPQALAGAIVRLDGDRPLLRRMGLACRERIDSHYAVERLARDFGRVYRAMLAPPVSD